jgi:hypothetical protein
MNLIKSLLFIFLVAISTGSHTYHVWKKQDFRTLKVQIAIMSLAILTGLLLIFFFQTYSIAYFINELSPINK